MKDDFQSILENGISFGRGGREKKDDDGNHFFTTFDGWLCYGRRPGFSLKIR